MLESLPHARIPEYLSRLLSVRPESNAKMFRYVEQIMAHDNFLRILINKFIQASSYSDINTAFKIMNFRDFRNQLTALYFEFYETGIYSHFPDLKYIQDLIHFEARFDSFAPSESNKVFLLGVYLKFSDAHLQSKGLMGDFEFINP